jgi:hypothetical protein
MGNCINYIKQILQFENIFKFPDTNILLVHAINDEGENLHHLIR